MTEATGVASERDREYLRRLGEFENEARADALREWLDLPLGERLRRSSAYHTSMTIPETREPEEPEKFYEHVKRLGLYRD